MSSEKPRDYYARRTWQNEQRASGKAAECGREACNEKADPPYVNRGTPLLYCRKCAELINHYNPGACQPEPRARSPSSRSTP